MSFSTYFLSLHFLFLIFSSIFSICLDSKNINNSKINLALNSLNINTFELNWQAENPIVVGKFNRSKLDNKDYDSLDLRVEFKKNNEIEEYKINNYLILPVTNKKRYWNDSLIFKKFSTVGIDLGNSLELFDNFKTKIIWKNNISLQYELPRVEEKITVSGNVINFSTITRFQTSPCNIEIGYNLLFKSENKIKTENKVNNKIFCILNKDVKALNQLLNICLDVSYSLESFNDKNLNILASIFCLF